jgi:hypothetical protein
MRRLDQLFFRRRISLRSSVFFADTRDHEFESSITLTRKPHLSGRRLACNQLKSQEKSVRCDFFVPPAGALTFCTENESKALALCAARSHIVAVR